MHLKPFPTSEPKVARLAGSIFISSIYQDVHHQMSVVTESHGAFIVETSQHKSAQKDKWCDKMFGENRELLSHNLSIQIEKP